MVISEEPFDEVPKTNIALEFLWSAAKVASIVLAITPLPTYLGVYGKEREDQLKRVESINFSYLLLTILNTSIWTSYAYKTKNIDLAIISIVPLIISIVLSTIYLAVKKEM